MPEALHLRPDPLRVLADGPRVLVVTTALAPDQLHTWQEASKLPDVDLHLAGSLVGDVSESYLAPLAVPDWGTIHVLPAAGWIGRGRLWWNLDGLEALIDRLQPDVVHVHSEVWGRLVGQALRTGAPVVAHGAENVSLDHGAKAEAKVRKAIAVHNAGRLAGYASWNQAGVDLLRANGLRATAPVAVAPAIVPDPTPYLTVDRSYDRPGPVRVGYVGRLVPEKGVSWLIDSLAGIDDAVLVVVGSGSYEATLRHEAERRGLAVEWHANVAPSEVPAVYAALDVVVVPSVVRPGWAEQFGRVVCEAMLTGLPVVSSDSGSLPEVVGTAGLVVPEHDRAALRAALAGLVADPSSRARIGQAARGWAVAELSPEAAARRLGTMWRDVAR